MNKFIIIHEKFPENIVASFDRLLDAEAEALKLSNKFKYTYYIYETTYVSKAIIGNMAYIDIGPEHVSDIKTVNNSDEILKKTVKAYLDGEYDGQCGNWHFNNDLREAMGLPIAPYDEG